MLTIHFVVGTCKQAYSSKYHKPIITTLGVQTMKPVLFAALISCFSVATYAACTDSQQQCVIYKNGNVATEGGCTVSKCQNADAQVLKWKLKNGKGVTVEIGKNGKVLVNKKPGAKVNNSNASGMGLTCYAADADKREQFCSTNY